MREKRICIRHSMPEALAITDVWTEVFKHFTAVEQSRLRLVCKAASKVGIHGSLTRWVSAGFEFGHGSGQFYRIRFEVSQGIVWTIRLQYNGQKYSISAPFNTWNADCAKTETAGKNSFLPDFLYFGDHFSDDCRDTHWVSPISRVESQFLSAVKSGLLTISNLSRL